MKKQCLKYNLTVPLQLSVEGKKPHTMENIKSLLKYPERANLSDPCKWREITLMIITRHISPARHRAAGELLGIRQRGHPALGHHRGEGLSPPRGAHTHQRSQSGTSHRPSLTTSSGFNHHLHAGWEVQSNPRAAFTLRQTQAEFFCCCLVLFLVMKPMKNGNTYVSPTRPIFYQAISATQHYPGNARKISTEQKQQARQSLKLIKTRKPKKNPLMSSCNTREKNQRSKPMLKEMALSI